MGSRRRLRAAHAGAVAAGLVAGAILGLLVFFRVERTGGLTLVARFDLRAFVLQLPEHRRWLVPFALLAATQPAWRALVWRSVIGPPRPRYADAYHATALGGLVHNAVPGKLGPFAAAFVLARAVRHRYAEVLSTQLVAKLLELGAVVAVGALAAAALPGSAGVRGAVIAGAALFAVLAGVALAVAVLAPRTGARLALRLPRVGSAIAALGEGVAAAGSPARIVAALVVALAPVLTAAAAYAIPLAAFGVPASAAGGAVLVAVITFGQLTPGLPVGAGVYWSLAAWAARTLGAAPADAAALAVLSHAAMVVTSLAVGGLSALVRRGALGELLRRRRELPT